MRVEASATGSFARHESFHPRYGWMKKAVDGAASDPHVFSREDAVVTLGVGKNMVRAIKFWGLAAKLLTLEPDAESPRQPKIVPTRLGHTIFSDEGWDPYCEDRGTLWLVHWLLLAPKSLLPVWWIAFNEFTAIDFSDEDLRAFVGDFVSGISDWREANPSSIKKDMDCLLRMYTAEATDGRPTGDDLVDCPFRDLGLLRPGTQRRRFRFVTGHKPGLPGEVVLYAALDFVARTDGSAQSVNLSRLANEPGGPGRAFLLGEQKMADLVTSVAEETEGLTVLNNNGVTQLAFKTSPAELATQVLHSYYNGRNPTAAKPIDVIAGLNAEAPASAIPVGAAS